MSAGLRTVVGTRVELARDDDRSASVLVSDLHLPIDGGPATDAFLQLVSSIAAPESSRLLVLGDLFDAYIGPKQNRVGVYRDVAEALRKAADRGLSVTVLHGNRDFMLDAAFERAAGCRVVAGGLRIQLGERRLLLLHGDELCQRDEPYQRAKRYLRHPWTRAVLRNLPLGLALHLAQRARDKSRKVIASGDQTRFDPTAAAMHQALSAADGLVFGHIHRPAHGMLGSREYWILPAFDETGVYLESADGTLRYRHVDGETTTEYAPRTFQ